MAAKGNGYCLRAVGRAELSAYRHDVALYAVHGDSELPRDLRIGEASRYGMENFELSLGERRDFGLLLHCLLYLLGENLFAADNRMKGVQEIVVRYVLRQRTGRTRRNRVRSSTRSSASAWESSDRSSSRPQPIRGLARPCYLDSGISTKNAANEW